MLFRWLSCHWWTQSCSNASGSLHLKDVCSLVLRELAKLSWLEPWLHNWMPTSWRSVLWNIMYISTNYWVVALTKTIIHTAEDLSSCSFGELEETTRTPSYYMDEDCPARLEIKQPVPEWSNWHGSVSSSVWRLMSTFGTTQCHSSGAWQKRSQSHCENYRCSASAPSIKLIVIIVITGAS